MAMTRHNTPRWLLLGWNVNDLFLRSFGTVDVGNVPSNFSCDVSFIVPECFCPIMISLFLQPLQVSSLLVANPQIEGLVICCHGIKVTN